MYNVNYQSEIYFWHSQWSFQGFFFLLLLPSCMGTFVCVYVSECVLQNVWVMCHPPFISRYRTEGLYLQKGSAFVFSYLFIILNKHSMSPSLYPHSWIMGDRSWWSRAVKPFRQSVCPCHSYLQWTVDVQCVHTSLVLLTFVLLFLFLIKQQRMEDVPMSERSDPLQRLFLYLENVQSFSK